MTLRVVAGVGSLRRYHPLRVVRAAIAKGGHRDDFRIVEFNLLSNHLHIIVEATGAEALARGMQGFNVRVARGINRVLGRRGSLFAERYHCRALRTPTEVRHAVRYVLLNQRHHIARGGARPSGVGARPVLERGLVRRLEVAGPRPRAVAARAPGHAAAHGAGHGLAADHRLEAPRPARLRRAPRRGGASSVSACLTAADRFMLGFGELLGAAAHHR